MKLFTHVPHPRTQEVLAGQIQPVKIADQARGKINGRVALRLTALVGTMQAAYLFTVLALVALPSVLGYNWFPSRTLIVVAWVSQTFIQLVMLAVLQLGQNLSGAAADARAEATFQDAESILHECVQLQAHLAEQDKVLMQRIGSP